MDFIDQVKKVKEITKSPEVRALCESYLSGGSISKEKLVVLINEHNTSMDLDNTGNNIQNHMDLIKKEESEISKKAAASLMESWGGLGKSTSGNNSGSYSDKPKENKDAENSLYESISNLGTSDLAAKSFVETQGIKNLGIRSAIEKIKESSIYTYPKAKMVCEQYQYLLDNKNIPEFSLINNFVNELASFSWDSSIAPIAEELKEKAKSFSREIEVAKVLESIKNSGSSSFYSELSETLNEWLVSENKSNGLLVRNISKFSFNPVIKNLINFLNIHESSDGRKLEVPVNIQGESSVSKVYSPVLFENGRTFFFIGGCIFEATSNSLRKLSKNEYSSLSENYLRLSLTTMKPHVRINESGISVKLGKKIVTMVEENNNVAVYLGKDKLRFGDSVGLAKIIGLESSSYFGVNESEVVGDIMTLYTNYSDIVELDFAKSITSNVYEGLSINLFKWNGQIYLQKINEAMRENSLYEVNGSQAVALVKNFMRYDISEGLTEFLDGESKVKSVMVNDRNKVLENISKIEGEITKVETLMESNPLYKNSKEIQAAHLMLEKELQSLKTKWNQINIEIQKIDEDIELQPNPDLFEDQKFNIGSFVKVKESGETGKVISIDGSSGRYTVLLDSGKTADHQINELADLDEALNKAADNNEESADSQDNNDENGEVKESNNLNKSDLPESEQKKMLKKLAGMHGFSKAPVSDNEKIDMDGDSLHGYNRTMNEAKADLKNGTPKTNYSKAPGNDKKAPASAIKNKTLVNAPDKKGKSKLTKGTTDPNFSDAPGDDAMGKGKNANAKKNLAAAPGNHNKVNGKELGKDNLRSAPDDKNGDFRFEASDIKDREVYGGGYNIKESEEVKKN
jgi:hypothetical protein